MGRPRLSSGFQLECCWESPSERRKPRALEKVRLKIIFKRKYFVEEKINNEKKKWVKISFYFYGRVKFSVNSLTNAGLMNYFEINCNQQEQNVAEI